MSTTSTVLSPEETQIVRNMYAGFPEAEVVKFLFVAQALGLNPVFRQIYLIEGNDDRRRTKTYTAVCSIDGYRTAAERKGERAGHETDYIYSSDGKFLGVKWTLLRASSPNRIDRYPAVALFDEFAARDGYGNLTKFWRERPEFMTAKCAEALAHRIAYPFLGGTYTVDEMERSISGALPGSPQVSREIAALSDEAVRTQFMAFIGERGIDACSALKVEGDLAAWPLDQMRVALSDPESVNKKITAAALARAKAQIAALTEPELRSAFENLVNGRLAAAAQVFKAIIPADGDLAKISIVQLRVVIAEPYRSRYSKKLDAASAALAAASEAQKNAQPTAASASDDPLIPAPSAPVTETVKAEATPERAQVPAVAEGVKVDVPVPAAVPAPLAVDSKSEAGLVPATSDTAPAIVKTEIEVPPVPATVSTEAILPASIQEQFAALVDGRAAAAAIVFKHIMPASGKVEEIDVAKLRLVLTEPYRGRYSKKLEDAHRSLQTGSAPAAVPLAGHGASTVPPLPESQASATPADIVSVESAKSNLPAAVETRPVAPDANDGASQPPAAVDSSATQTPAQLDRSVAASSRVVADGGPIDPAIAALSDSAVREQFSSLIAGRIEAAQTVFSGFLPPSGNLAEIPVDRLRAVLSPPYRARYQTRLTRTAKAARSEG